MTTLILKIGARKKVARKILFAHKKIIRELLIGSSTVDHRSHERLQRELSIGGTAVDETGR